MCKIFWDLLKTWNKKFYLVGLFSVYLLYILVHWIFQQAKICIYKVPGRIRQLLCNFITNVIKNCMNKKERIDYIDGMRGMAIILVVLGHLLQYNLVDGEHNPVFSIIYSFHMPLFFAISGYVATLGSKITNIYEFFRYIRKKTLSILLPFLVWTFIVNKFVFAKSWNVLTLEDLISELSDPWLWFLKSLYLIFLIYAIYNFIDNKICGTKTYIKEFIQLSIVAAISILFIKMGITYQNFLLYSVSFYFGLFVSKYGLVYNFIHKDSVYVVAAILFFVLVGHYNFGIGSLSNQLLQVILIFVSFSFFMNVFQRVKLNNLINGQLVFIGKNTLVIYILQFYFMRILPNENHLYVENSFVLFVVGCALSIIICYACLFINTIIKSFPYLDLLLLGHTKK